MDLLEKKHHHIIDGNHKELKTVLLKIPLSTYEEEIDIKCNDIAKMVTISISKSNNLKL